MLQALGVCVALSAGPSCPTSAAHDLVFLSPRGPVLIRLHLRRDWLPLRERFSALMDDVFRGLDRDGDGKISAKEAERAPTFGIRQGVAAPPEGLTRAGLEAAYAKMGLGMLSLRRVAPRPLGEGVRTPGLLTRRLF